MNNKDKTSTNSEQTMTPEERRAAKKAAVLGTNRKNRTPLIAALLCLLAVAGVAGAYFLIQPKTTRQHASMAQTTAQQAAATQIPEIITHAESLFIDGVAKFFTYQHEQITIKYFMLRSSDGAIRAAFDACDVCWPAGKGYRQEGDFMICNNCGRSFASLMVNEVSGGCNPSPLTRTVQNNQVIVRVEDLLKGKQYFDFSQQKRT